MIPKIQFISLIEGIEETMPVIPASEQKYGWVKRAGALTKELNKSQIGTKHHSTLKCPAIFQFRNNGFIVRLPFDIKIKINSELDYEWHHQHQTPGWLSNTGVMKEFVTHHDIDLMYNFMSSWPQDTMKIILKLNLPWALRIPKGFDVLMIDAFYKDDNRFTVCPGIFESELGIGNLTVPVMWHSTKGEFLIKAGTPIAQLVPIKKETVSHQNLNLTTDKNFRRDGVITFLKMRESFEKNYNKTREFLKDKISS
jgi:hypothetical protein